MALPLPPTLVQLQESVAIRVGLATSGNIAKSLEKVVREHLNKCQRELYLRCSWARQVIDVQIPTQQAVRDYDVPDEAASIGAIQRIDVEDIDGVRRALQYDDALPLESNLNYVNSPNVPTTWQFIDDVIRVTPTVNAQVWVKFNVRLIKADKPLIEGGDRASVDGEALVQYATIVTKEYLGTNGPQQNARAEFERYLLDLRSSSVGPGRSFNIASDRPTGVPYWRYPTAEVAPYSPTWNPSGYW
jgi:hypothetical protein